MKNFGGSIGWGADVPISMPEALPTTEVVYIDMGTFGFTANGLAHNMRSADLETYETPMFAPEPLGAADGEVPG